MKNPILSCVCLILSIYINAQSQGPLNGTGFSTEIIPGANRTWDAASDAAVSDDLYANFGDITGGVGSYTDYLMAINFGFSIPGGTTITGITVEVECSDPNGRTSDYSVRISKAKTVGSSDRAVGTPFPASDAYLTYGGPGDLWGETWTDADINDGGFGVVIATQRNAPGGATGGRIDDIRITVYYTFGTLPVKLINFGASKKNNSVELKWTTSEEVNINHYEIERSANGHDFTSLASIASRNQRNQISYSTIDTRPISGIAYYRLKIVDNNNDLKYSKIATVHFKSSNQVIIYPSLWKKGTPLHISNPNHEKLTVYFFNSSGKLAGKTTSTTSEITVETLSNVQGTIIYRIINEKGELAGSGELIAN